MLCEVTSNFGFKLKLCRIVVSHSEEPKPELLADVVPPLKICHVTTESSLTTADVIRRVVTNRTQYIDRNKVRCVKELTYLKEDKVFVEEK